MRRPVELDLQSQIYVRFAELYSLRLFFSRVKSSLAPVSPRHHRVSINSMGNVTVRCHENITT